MNYKFIPLNNRISIISKIATFMIFVWVLNHVFNSGSFVLFRLFNLFNFISVDLMFFVKLLYLFITIFLITFLLS